MTPQHTHNPPEGHGRYNLVGQVKPDYLDDALDNAAAAHRDYEVMIDTDIMPDELEHLRKFANECEQLARDAYTRRKQEVCPHSVTRTDHTGSEYAVQGEHYENDTGGVERCIRCHKEIEAVDSEDDMHEHYDGLTAYDFGYDGDGWD